MPLDVGDPAPFPGALPLALAAPAFVARVGAPFGAALPCAIDALARAAAAGADDAGLLTGVRLGAPPFAAVGFFAESCPAAALACGVAAFSGTDGGTAFGSTRAAATSGLAGLLTPPAAGPGLRAGNFEAAGVAAARLAPVAGAFVERGASTRGPASAAGAVEAAVAKAMACAAAASAAAAALATTANAAFFILSVTDSAADGTEAGAATLGFGAALAAFGFGLFARSGGKRSRSAAAAAAAASAMARRLSAGLISSERRGLAIADSTAASMSLARRVLIETMSTCG